ncbi:hypothetical protein DRJ16_03255 [Candidatus Woesearchaeota archaeon]|nr:MAG: hypothetical protein DRJ16_03255 [Candidatus Woesearchaeota archaeon]
MKAKIAPLPGSFMLTALVGLLLSIFFIWPLSATWGFTFTLFFAIMLVAAMISMTKAPSY